MICQILLSQNLVAAKRVSCEDTLRCVARVICVCVCRVLRCSCVAHCALQHSGVLKWTVHPLLDKSKWHWATCCRSLDVLSRVGQQRCSIWSQSCGGSVSHRSFECCVLQTKCNVFTKCCFDGRRFNFLLSFFPTCEIIWNRRAMYVNFTFLSTSFNLSFLNTTTTSDNQPMFCLFILRFFSGSLVPIVNTCTDTYFYFRLEEHCVKYIVHFYSFSDLRVTNVLHFRCTLLEEFKRLFAIWFDFVLKGDTYHIFWSVKHFAKAHSFLFMTTWKILIRKQDSSNSNCLFPLTTSITKSFVWISNLEESTLQSDVSHSHWVFLSGAEISVATGAMFLTRYVPQRLKKFHVTLLPMGKVQIVCVVQPPTGGRWHHHNLVSQGTAGQEAEAGMEMSALVNYVQPTHFHTFELADSRFKPRVCVVTQSAKNVVF